MVNSQVNHLVKLVQCALSDKHTITYHYSALLQRLLLRNVSIPDVHPFVPLRSVSPEHKLVGTQKGCGNMLPRASVSLSLWQIKVTGQGHILQMKL